MYTCVYIHTYTFIYVYECIQLHQNGTGGFTTSNSSRTSTRAAISTVASAARRRLRTPWSDLSDLQRWIRRWLPLLWRRSLERVSSPRRGSACKHTEVRPNSHSTTSRCTKLLRTGTQTSRATMRRAEHVDSYAEQRIYVPVMHRCSRADELLTPSSAPERLANCKVALSTYIGLNNKASMIPFAPIPRCCGSHRCATRLDTHAYPKFN